MEAQQSSVHMKHKIGCEIWENCILRAKKEQAGTGIEPISADVLYEIDTDQEVLSAVSRSTIELSRRLLVMFPVQMHKYLTMT